jgi:carboxylate-amine ligase
MSPVVGRRVGVEEELFLVDPETRRLAAVSDHVIGMHERRAPDDELEHELFLQQVETSTAPHTGLDDLMTDLRAQRRMAVTAAEAAGVAAVAVATPVLGDETGDLTPNDRYERMMARYGELGRRALVCATHVHVEVEDDEAVGVVDDVRAWLPLLLAVSAGSPFDHGTDTGYASWRAQVWDAWPSAGPVEPFGDRAGYRAAVDALVASGAAIDEGMIYLDVRLARAYPTVEIRVADVCTDLADTLLVAELSRALVETTARARAAGATAPPWRVEMLRAARWRARRHGLAGDLVDPVSRAVVPAAQALTTLLDHVGPVLDEHGSGELVRDGVARLLRDGTGAERQRAVASERGLEGVVDDLVARTRESAAAR